VVAVLVSILGQISFFVKWAGRTGIMSPLQIHSKYTSQASFPGPVAPSACGKPASDSIVSNFEVKNSRY
jgi:hypothetical protein